VYTPANTHTNTHLYTCIVKNRRRSEKRRGNQRKATAEAEEKKGAVGGTGNGGCGAVEIEREDGEKEYEGAVEIEKEEGEKEDEGGVEMAPLLWMEMEGAVAPAAPAAGPPTPAAAPATPADKDEKEDEGGVEMEMEGAVARAAPAAGPPTPAAARATVTMRPMTDDEEEEDPDELEERFRVANVIAIDHLRREHHHEEGRASAAVLEYLNYAANISHQEIKDFLPTGDLVEDRKEMGILTGRWAYLTGLWDMEDKAARVGAREPSSERAWSPGAGAWSAGAREPGAGAGAQASGA
jgi:hypothetical protein